MVGAPVLLDHLCYLAVHVYRICGHISGRVGDTGKLVMLVIGISGPGAFR